MSFRCVSRFGLTISGSYLPHEMQELIANFALPSKYRERYDDVMREIVVELAVGSAMPINNIEPTKVQNLLAEFDFYDIHTIVKVINNFKQAIYWHSTTHIQNFNQHYNNPHLQLLQFSYQDLLALKYYISCIYNIYSVDGKNNFTNTWFPAVLFPWGVLRMEEEGAYKLWLECWPG